MLTEGEKPQSISKDNSDSSFRKAIRKGELRMAGVFLAWGLGTAAVCGIGTAAIIGSDFEKLERLQNIELSATEVEELTEQIKADELGIAILAPFTLVSAAAGIYLAKGYYQMANSWRKESETSSIEENPEEKAK